MPDLEQRRLDALRRLELLDAPAEPAFDRLASLARTVLDVPAVFISLLDRDRDFFLSVCDEKEVLGSAREITGETFCRHALRSDDPLIVPDARSDPRFSSLGVVQQYGVAAYAGAPLKMSDGLAIGVFCAVDYEPREWTEQDVAALCELATLTVTEIELRDAHRTAADERERYQELVHGLDAIVWEMDARAFTFTFVSEHAVTLLGYPVERWLSERGFWQDTVVHPDDRDAALALCVRAIEEQRHHLFEYRAIAADGTVLWLQDRVRVLPPSGGRPLRLSGVMVDISDRKRLEAEHRAAETRYHRLVENAPYAIYSLDLDGRFTEVNPAGEALLGRASAWLRGRHISEVVAPRDLPLALESMRSRTAGEQSATDVELHLLHSSGELRLAHIRATASRQDGLITGTHGIARDITDERRLQEHLRRAERMASIGTLISGVAQS